MPLKWKIFRIANYLLLLLSLFITGLVTYFFSISDLTSNELFYYVLFAGGGTVVICNFSLNIYFLEKYYPEAEIQRSLTRFATVILLLSCMTIGFLTLLFVVEFYDMVISPNYSAGLPTRPFLFLLVFGTILLISYYIFWMQVALRKTIMRNRQKLYAAFLESN